MMYPLSPAQAFIWADILLNPDKSPAYNIAGYQDVRGALALDVYEVAFNHVLEHVPILRTGIASGGATPTQCMAPYAPSALRVLDFRDDPDGGNTALGWMREQIRTKLDVKNGQVYAQAMLRISDDILYRYLVFHHLVVDGIGISFINEYIAKTYNALIQGAPPPVLAAQDYSAYVARQRELAGSADYLRAEAFWRELWTPYLNTANTAAGESGSGDGGATPWYLEYTLFPAQYKRIEEIARAAGVAISRVLIAIVAVYWASRTDAEWVPLGLTHHGRSGDTPSDLIGMCTNTLPLLLQVSRGTAPAGQLAAVSQQIGEALDHHVYRFEDFLKRIYRRRGRFLPFEVTINVLRRRSTIRYQAAPAYTKLLSIGPINGINITFVDRVEGDSLRLELRTHAGKYTEQASRTLLHELVARLTEEQAPA